MPKSPWRALLFAGILVSAVLLVLQLPPSHNYPDLGFTSHEGATPSQLVVTAVAPRSVAADAGLRAGDSIDLAALSLGDRIRLIYERRAGDVIPVVAVRDGKRVPLTIAPHGDSAVPATFWLGFAGTALLIAFAALIAWRRPHAPIAQLLAWVLLTNVFGTVLGATHFGTGSATSELVVWALAALIAPIGPLLFARYAGAFGSPNKTRDLLYRAQFVLALIAAAFELLPVITVLTLRIGPDLANFIAYIDPGIDLQYGLALVSAILAIRASRGEEQQRIYWATIVTAPFIIVGMLLGLPGIPDWIGDIALLIWPIGLAYAAQRGQLLDVRFAISRAAVYGSVSLIVLVLFVGFEAVLAEFFKPFGHEADIYLSLGFALVLGLLLRWIHHLVNHIIEKIMGRLPTPRSIDDLLRENLAELRSIRARLDQLK